MAQNRMKFGIPCRVVMAVMGHLGFAILYTFRVNMSVALVSMVNATFADAKSSASLDPECTGSYENSSKNSHEEEGMFNYDQNQQGLILGSFFYGYMCTQIVGGVLSIKYGGKWVFGLCVLFTSVLTLATPIAADTGINVLIGLRFAEGFVEGASMPSLHALLAKWSPPLERSKLASLLYSGGTVGTVVAMPVSGILCDHGFAGGWPSVFYVFGLLGIFWFFFWVFLGYSGPETHPRISRYEHDYILSSQGPAVNHEQQHSQVPWLSILRSGAVLGILIPYCASNWVFYTALTCLPKYFKEVLNFAIEKNGILSALPFLASVVCQFIGANFADYFISRQMFSVQTTRKIFTTIALGIPSLIYGVLGYLGCAQENSAVALMVLAVALNGFSLSGFAVNHLDISPNYAALLQGVTNTVATIPGCVAPSIVGYFTENQPTRQQWQKVLFISSGVSAFGALSFLLLGKGTVQPWNGDYECIDAGSERPEADSDQGKNVLI